MPTTFTPAWTSVSNAEKLTCSAPTISARVPMCGCRSSTSCCSRPVVSTPSGREPGTSRAGRGRSRQPVARTIADARSDSTLGSCYLERSVRRPARDRRLRADVYTYALRELDVPPRIGRPRRRAVEVADTKALMRAVTWDPTGPFLALEHENARDPPPSKPD